MLFRSSERASRSSERSIRSAERSSRSSERSFRSVERTDGSAERANPSMVWAFLSLAGAASEGQPVRRTFFESFQAPPHVLPHGFAPESKLFGGLRVPQAFHEPHAQHAPVQGRQG